MTDTKFFYNCGICGSRFQFGPHRYDGKHISRYNLTVCMGCWQGNHDGWGSSAEAPLLDHLKKEGIAIPPRNTDGWLPRE